MVAHGEFDEDVACLNIRDLVNFALLKLKSFVPSKSSGSWVVVPRADAGLGVLLYQGL